MASKRDLLKSANAANREQPTSPKKTAETFVDVIASAQQSELADVRAEEPKKNKVGRRSDDEPKTQVSVYLTDSLIRQLRMAAAEQVKEKDKSAIVRTGLEIVLSLSDENYIRLKEEARQKETTVGAIIDQAVTEYLTYAR